MKNDRKMERELIAELESAYQKVYEMEAQLKEHGNREGNETERLQTLSEMRESEIRYRRFFEAAKDGILILDADSGMITDANPFIKEILGYSQQDLIGKRLWEIGAFFDVVASKAVFEELQRKEYIRYENLPLQTKDGQLREVEFISNAYIVDLKKVIQCNIRNITKRREAEKALEESEVRYRRVFESAKDGILVLDAETGKIIDANPFLLDILNFPKEEVIGRELWEIGPFKNIIANQDTFRKLQHQEYVRYEHLLLQNKSGVTIHVEFISNFYLMNERKVIQCNIQDITERKKIEYALHESEERFRTLYENSTIGLYRTTPDGKIILANPTLIGMLGYSSFEELAVRNLEQEGFEPSYERKHFIEKIELNGEVKNLESAWSRQDGLTVYVRESARAIRDSDGKTLYYDGTVEDITERKRAEEALIESQALYYSFIEQLPNAVFRKDREGRYVLVNSQFCKLKGLKKENFIGRKPKEVAENERALHGEQGHATEYSDLGEDAHELIMRTGKILEAEEKYPNKDGTIEFMHVIRMPVFDSQGTIVGTQGIMFDITQRVQMEQQVRQMQKLEGLGTLAGGIAHDFNNILGIILGYSTGIKRFNDDPKKLDLAAETITKAVDRGRTLVQSILTFARKTETTFGAVNVNDVVMEIMTMILETFPKTLTYSQNFDKAIPYINADRSQLHQALLNLCINARDAMPKGGVLTINTRMVSIEKLRNQHPDADSSSYVCIEVSDTGEGISEEIQKRMFEPFFTTKGIGKGTGLGLSVVFGVIQSHKGFIDVDSELGNLPAGKAGGTTFRLYLPTSQVVLPVSVKKEVTMEEIPGGTETLLVIEDEEMLMMPLQTVLIDKGYKVLSVGDGFTALKIYQERKNDIALVLTDLGLPNISGLEVCNKIKKINPNQRIILASGYIDPNMKSELLKVSVQHFLYKPYDFTQVLKMVREVLDKK